MRLKAEWSITMKLYYGQMIFRPIKSNKMFKK